MAINDTKIVNNLPPVPKAFESDTELWRFFNAIRERIGGSSGNLIYDASIAASTTAAIEPFLLGVVNNVEERLTGLALQIVEQIRANPEIVGPLLIQSEPRPIDQIEPALFQNQEIERSPQIPEEFGLAGIIQMSKANADVKSVFGRIGDIVAVDGDYDLTELGDVTITAPTTDQVLKYNGSAWVNGTPSTFSGVLPVSNGGTGASALTAENVILGDGTNPVKFVAPGTSGNILTSNGTTWTSAAPAAAPSIDTYAPYYEEATATAGQTVFNTTVKTVANASGRSYLQVTVNGLVQREGGGKDYTVTGANQITFNSGLVLNDEVTFRSWAV